MLHVQGVFSSDINLIEEDKKVLCQLLNKLYIPDTVDDYKIRSIKLLIDHLRTVSVFSFPLSFFFGLPLDSGDSGETLPATPH
jgi:hypothetical protein